MKKIIFIIWLLFLLTSCYSNPKDTKKIEELESKIEKIEENDSFEKNQECAKYKDSMLEDAQNKNIDWMTRTWDTYKIDIEEIFYNKENRTCIYIITIDKFIDLVVWWKYTDYIPLNKYAYDYLSKKELFSTIDLSNEDFERQLNLLKNN